MYTVASNKFPVGLVLHWIACVTGTALVLLIAAFVIGDPPPPVLLLDPQVWALLVMVAGFLVTWRNDLVGGVMGIAGAAMFYLMNFEKAGNFPGGWVFPLCFIPGVLAVISGLMQRHRGANR